VDCKDGETKTAEILEKDYRTRVESGTCGRTLISGYNPCDIVTYQLCDK
jgi:hypothetical protein